MKVLFITRKYPPQVGGMEKYSYDLIKHFPAEKKVISLNKSQIHLIWFLPYALIKAIYLSRKVDLIFLCDGLLAPIGFIIKIITKKPVISAVMGLDVTYNNKIYQNINVRSLKHLDGIISISIATINECLKRNIAKEKIIFIPIGVNYKISNNNKSKNELSKFIKKDISNKKIFITVGRLVERKGVEWFVTNVIPKLSNDIVYLIIGDGPNKDNINNAVINNKAKNKVFLLGRISDTELDLIYSTADIFIMPNIKVNNDLEGFGIVAIEASSHGLPVIASRLEGIQDAIINNKTGFFAEPENASSFINKINEILTMQEYNKSNLRSEIHQNTIKYYSWNNIMNQYNKFFKYVINK